MNHDNSYKTFEDLEAWQACRNLRLFICKEVVPGLPACERYRLGDQLVRSSRSTTANIAEGYGRFYYKDAARFMSNSRGSCQEVLDHLITGVDEDLIPQKMLDLGRDLVDQASKLLNGYMNYLKRADSSSSRIQEAVLP